MVAAKNGSEGNMETVRCLLLAGANVEAERGNDGD